MKARIAVLGGTQGATEPAVRVLAVLVDAEREAEAAEELLGGDQVRARGRSSYSKSSSSTS